MSYKINGTTLTLQPETGKWSDNEQIGVDGNGHAIYSATREFELQWGVMSMSEWNELNGLFSAIGSTGTAVVELPQYAGSSWAFHEYSGTVLREPRVGDFFEQHVTDVTMLIVKIKT